jgi:hypothetical protein
MSRTELPEWEKLIELAEKETDLEKTREYLELAETALFFRSNEILCSRDGYEESEALHQAPNRLLRIKSEKLKWPDPFTKAG